jgi:hypothetical protein
VIDEWDSAARSGRAAAGRRTPLEGKFGFDLPAGDEILVSNFVYDPRSR